MRRTVQLVLLVLSTYVSTLAQSTPAALTAHDVVARWRDAVHAMKLTQDKTALLVSTSNQDGVRGEVEGHEAQVVRGQERITIPIKVRLISLDRQ